MIGIKGPLTTPIGGGFRSLNVALRQILDLYVCLRPGPLVQGSAVAGQGPLSWSTWSIFRENTEDIYAGLEVEAMSPDALKLRELLEDAFGWKIREDAGIGIKTDLQDGFAATAAGCASSTPSTKGRQARSTGFTRATS